jgi:hypothetical protein
MAFMSRDLSVRKNGFWGFGFITQRSDGVPVWLSGQTCNLKIQGFPIGIGDVVIRDVVMW